MCYSKFDTFQVYAQIVFASLSILSSFIVMFICIKYSFIKTLAFRIVFFMSINDILRGIITLLPKTQQYCGIIFFIQNATYMSNLSWATCLSCTIHQIVVSESCNYSKYFPYWFILSFILIPIIESLPIFTKTFTEQNNNCIFEFSLLGNILRYSILYIPGTLMLVLILVLFVKIYKKVKLIGIESVKSLVYERGFIYPLIMASICVPLIVFRTIEVITLDCYSGVVCSILDDLVILHGFFNALAFFLNASVARCLFGDDEGSRVNESFAESSLRLSFRTNFTINVDS